MRAVVCPVFGEPDVLVVEEWEAPRPGHGQVVVAPEAWGVNFVDVLMVAGGYQLRPELPFVPGLEAAGQILSVGAGVTRFNEGDRVIIGMRPGTFAEQVVIPETALLAMPAAMSMEQGACFRSAFQTAYHGLVQGGRLATGEVALIHEIGRAHV